MEEVNLIIESKQQALDVYLPFVKQGAVLVHVVNSLELGEEVILNISFPELKKEMRCQGKVVWVSAKTLQGRVNFGIQFFGEDCISMQQTIEKYLTGHLNDE
ncbi:PilZ domain-containing protein [Facilibium subflavum]|uniref:PilZ domain-containing protein n=1 Tax=Facilibium subflavum TaxID=2219058 RepID=UPI000E64B234|nr:PilZ domain-containing protein [Facilibium subflavum]